MSMATIDNIKQLRAPYQDCVKARNANQNDIGQAAQWLKDQGKGTNRNAQKQSHRSQFSLNAHGNDSGIYTG